MSIASGTLCSTTVKKGPYKLLQDEGPQFKTPSRRIMEVERATIIQDAEITIMYRALWKSYCYNGGSLDWNTGCFSGLTQYVPTDEETTEWISRNECSVGWDCTDCYGSDSDACNNPEQAMNKWVKGKEMHKLQNNNHFAMHTCNLSWRCGIHKADYPTLMTRRNNAWVAYTEFSNGTELIMDTRDYWTFGDFAMKKTQNHQSQVRLIKMPCFTNADNTTACFDAELGNFMDFTDDAVCLGKTCYLIRERDSNMIEKENIVANLKAASIEDLRTAISTEHMLNEELRYNFGLVVAEITELRRILTQVILSSAKIDDKLLGNVMKHPAKSQFLSEEVFFLSPCAEPKNVTSNCHKGLVFKNGRWMKEPEGVECFDLNKTKEISLFKQQELWFPEIIDKQLIGTAADFEGWSYYANERDNLHESMLWTQNGQSTTSLNDLYALPKGLLNSALSGFLASNMAIWILLGIAGFLWLRSSRTNLRQITASPVIIRERMVTPTLIQKSAELSTLLPITININEKNVVPVNNTLQTVIMERDHRIDEADVNEWYEVPVKQNSNATDHRTVSANLDNICVCPGAPTLPSKDNIMLRDWQKPSTNQR